VSYPLGVDVGTTYTAAALWRDGRVQTVPLGNRANAVPSVLFLREDGAMLVGEPASRRGIGDPDRVAREFKRRMGDEIPILVGGRGFSAQQLTGEVLRWVINRVSELQGGPPQHVALTHPASWGEFRRNLLLQAAMSAGLRDVGLLPEPVAAATWYAAQERVEPGSLIGIYDFGGGTFDASVVRKTQTGMELYGEAGGDDSIGGVDFDHALFRHVGTAAGVDINAVMQDPAGQSALGQLFAAVVEAKEALSADLDTVVPVVLPGVSQQVLITRGEFEDMIRPQVVGTVGVFGQVVRRAGIDPARLHAVLLVGGSSRIPLVRELLSAELGIRVALDAHPKYTVSLGAAVAAAPRVAELPPRTTMAPGPVRPMPPLQPIQPPPTPIRPPAPVPVPSTQRGVRPVPMPPEAQPAVSEKVDLARTGLTGATDVAAVLAAIQPKASALALPDTRGPAVMRTRDGSSGSGRGRLVAVLVVLAIAAVVAAVAVFVLNGSNDTPPSSTSNTSPTPSITKSPAAGTFQLTGQLVAAPDGADAMWAAATLRSGQLVAVGVSAATEPRAWLTSPGGASTYVAPQSETKGKMSDVTALPGGGAVAVGFTGSDNTRRPAVWTTTNGTEWRLLPPQGDFRPNSGIVELYAVTVTTDGRLLAIGKDVRNDRTDGDAAVFTSTVGGNSWNRVPATGLDGTGPQLVRRVVVTKDGFMAVGSALSGAGQGAAMWTSTDGTTWQVWPYLPEGSPTLSALAVRGDGRLISCGSIGSSDRPEVSCWVQNEQQLWDRWDVGGSPTPLFLYGLVSGESGMLMVGAGLAGGSADAAVWVVS
jgi:actin-like ATPase involved in cell morphogenesis